MFKLALLPLIIPAVSGMLAWAMARYMEMAQEHRAMAATRPRSRPYATSLPKSLTSR